jgi:hypothetical protein
MGESDIENIIYVIFLETKILQNQIFQFESISMSNSESDCKVKSFRFQG